MRKFQTSRRGGIQDFLCPFTDMYITQGSNGAYSHRGTCANDVRGTQAGVRYPYYAPCDVKCIWIYPNSGQACWQSLEKVRFANDNIDYATFMTCHDDSFDTYVGMIRRQGEQIGNMGMNGNATGVHCHIEISQHLYNISNWHKNEHGIWCFDDETDPDDCYFVNDTNIIYGMGGVWKKLEDVPVSSLKYINIPEWIEERNIYRLGSHEQFATLKPKKFGGLTYKILATYENGYFAEIETRDFGHCLVRITDSTPITDIPTYVHGNY